MFAGTIDLLRQATAFAARRHELLAQNVANAETPGFQREAPSERSPSNAVSDKRSSTNHKRASMPTRSSPVKRG